MIRSMEFVHLQSSAGSKLCRWFCSHPVQHFTKLLQIRFTSGIINRSHPFGKHGSHHYIGCSGNRGFIEQHISTFQLLCRNLVYPTFFIISKVSSQVLDPTKCVSIADDRFYLRPVWISLLCQNGQPSVRSTSPIPAGWNISSGIHHSPDKRDLHFQL